MPPIIFNKDCPEYSIYESELQKWERSGKLDERAMAINMRYDHRVTKARELKFRKYFEPHRNLTRALQEHWDKEIKSNDKPEFCTRGCNNFVAFCARGDRGHCVGFDKKMRLATVINLNSYLEPVRDSSHAIRTAIPEWRDLENIDTHAVDYKSNLNTWLNTYMDNNYVKKGLDARNIEPLIRVMFKIINYRLTLGLAYQPVWVTNWDDLEEYTKNRRPDGSLDADRWNQVVGVPRDPAKWQIVVTYPASAVPCLHRPSILDGGQVYGQHFPSPPQIRKAVGGHTMDLGKIDKKVMSEFIHPQIPLKTRYWVKAGRLVGQTLTPGYYRSLPFNRIAHHGKLIDHYGEIRIKKWMADPN